MRRRGGLSWCTVDDSTIKEMGNILCKEKDESHVTMYTLGCRTPWVTVERHWRGSGRGSGSYWA